METSSILPRGRGYHPDEKGYFYFKRIMLRSYGRELSPGDPEFPEAKARYDKWHDDSLAHLRRLNKKLNRERWIGDLLCIPRLLWSSLIHVGMFSSDPQVSRDAMILTAREQYNLQQQRSQAQRAADRESRQEEMRVMGESIGRAIAQEMRRPSR